MTLALRNDFVDVFRTMDELWNRSIPRVTDSVKLTSSMDEKNYYIRAVIPGFSQEDVDINVGERMLRVSGKTSEKEGGGNLFSSSQRAFQQTYQLPHDAIPDKITADMKNGILVVNIPRWTAGQDKAARKITIGESPPALEE